MPELNVFDSFSKDDEIITPSADQSDNVEKTIIYHVADFSENIYDDTEYLDLVGPYAMFYKRENVEFSVTEEELSGCGEWAEFIYEYIECVKSGDHEGYNSLFFSDYFDSHEKKGEFTQQKIYDLRVEELSAPVNLDEEQYEWVYSQNLEVYGFDVKYKIRHNNGSFRLGINSDVYQPQLFILAHDRLGNIKIVDIVSYSH